MSLPAILRCYIEGCLAWQREGLNPSAVVRAASDAYLESEDALTLWIEECAVRPDTVVFDNTIQTTGALRDGRWEVPARRS